MQLTSSRTPRFSRLGLAFIVTSTVTIAVMLASLIVSFAYSEQTLPGNLVQQRAANRQHTTTTPRERAFRDVGLQMFQWPWNDIAHECRTSLGTMGIRRVLISPPHENLNPHLDELLRTRQLPVGLQTRDPERASPDGGNLPCTRGGHYR